MARVERRESPHTQRAYRGDVMAFVALMRIRWPEQAISLLAVSVKDVQAYRKAMIAHDAAAKTINRRVASLSNFYKYLAASSSELRLPITVPNPAHAQFIRRGSTDPRKETRALSATRARQLLAMPSGESVIDYRDRAILKLYLYSGIRLSTGCRLNVYDFHYDEEEATIRLHEREGRSACTMRRPRRSANISSKAGQLKNPHVAPKSRSQRSSASNLKNVLQWAISIDIYESNIYII